MLGMDVQALPVEDLYVAEVLVASRGEKELEQGARAGLRQVLVRVSGATEVHNNPMIASALRRPADYYYQFGYDTTERTLVVDGRDVPASVLRLSFEPSAVSRLLRQAGYPVWGSNRPGVLLWVAVNEGVERVILSEPETNEVAGSLSNEARYRGLPLLYPILDLEDAARLSTAEVWGLFLERIDVASIRYSPDVVLAGRVQRDETGQWTGRWFYRIEDRWQGLDNVDFSAADLVSKVIDQLADELASRYAVDSSQGSIMLRVESVDGLDAYAAVSEYLQSLSPVVDTMVVEVNADEILFRLSTEGQSEQLMEIIELDEKMFLINAGDRGTASSPLHYRWMGN